MQHKHQAYLTRHARHIALQSSKEPNKLSSIVFSTGHSSVHVAQCSALCAVCRGMDISVFASCIECSFTIPHMKRFVICGTNKTEL